jgi:hypothetical protein
MLLELHGCLVGAPRQRCGVAGAAGVWRRVGGSQLGGGQFDDAGVCKGGWGQGGDAAARVACRMPEYFCTLSQRG